MEITSNERKCPCGKNHKWRPIKTEDLTKEEDESIDRQIEFDSKNRKHHQAIMDETGKVTRTFQ